LGTVREWFGLPRLRPRARHLSDERARSRLVTRAALLRLNAPLASERDRETLLAALLERGLTVPMHWLSRDAAKSAERLLLTGQARIYCDAACTRYLTRP